MMAESFAQLQNRLMRAANAPHPDWMRALCDRCGIPWREEYAVPVDETPAPRSRVPSNMDP
jgi:hypothetical protein